MPYCCGRALDLSTPVIMGILNITPDSFFDGGNYLTQETQLKQVEKMLEEGASIIDLGAVSTRPGAQEVSQTDELDLLLPVVKNLRQHFPDSIISIDTFRPVVARAVVEQGADIINDIYGGRFEQGMLEVVSMLKVPYILMHMKGDPITMQVKPEYSDVMAEITYFFEQQLAKCRNQGITQVLLDPGFGFGKSVAHNFTILSHLTSLRSLGAPLVVGLSRKSMINKVLQTKPTTALNGTTVLNTIALIKGADILRVHDVKEAMEAIRLVNMLHAS
ncbi:MAG: dihydropteroate synthase [Bacteroidales bacterium]|nr:dihydropteroate synthase [Bacteroidales bacterium]